MDNLPANIKKTTCDTEADDPVYKSMPFAPGGLGGVNDAAAPAPLLQHAHADKQGTKGRSREQTSRSGDSKVPSMEDQSTWRVSPSSLKKIPDHCPVGRTLCVIPNWKASVSQIVERLFDAFKRMSIGAHYEGCSAFLITSENVEFCVHLYTTGSDETIVEVQRRKGCCFTFCRYARNVLAAAQGAEDADLDASISCVGPVTDKILELTEEGPSKEREYMVKALEIAGNLIRKDRLDANVLGLESLCLLTDPTKTSKLTAKLASRAVLCDTLRPTNNSCAEEEGGDEKSEEEELLVRNLGIRSSILDLVNGVPVEDTAIERQSELLYDTSRGEAKFYEDDYTQHLRKLALAVLANALNCASSEGNLKETMDSHQCLNGSLLVQRLLDVLRHAPNRPHDAVLSARCLGFLVQASQETSQRVIDCGALEVVEEAKRYGDRQHRKLAEESLSLRGFLKETCR